MINIEQLNSRPNLQDEFAYRQIGSITLQAESVDVSASIEYVLNFFSDNPEMHAVPIERNGVLIGILEKSHVEKMNQSAWSRFWQKDLDSYIDTPLLSLRADDYIDKNIERAMTLNNEKGVRFFAVYHRKSFFGIVGLHEMLTRITEIRARDMAKARMVQQHLLKPQEKPGKPGYAVQTFNQMANEVGGDFYKDFTFSDGERHIVACFDVSGKNVAASLSTMAIGSFFSALTLFEPEGTFGKEITALMDRYIQTVTPSEMFITAAICYIDTAKGSVFIQNCGHTPIYIFVPAEGGKIAGKTMNANMPPLGMGIIGDEDNAGFEIPIVKGLRIVLYTDGLTDMVTPDGERYDDERTRTLIASTYGKGEREAAAIYQKAIDLWMNDAMQSDDITVMDVRF